MRADKTAETITREKPVHPSTPKPAPAAMPKVSNPDRVIDPSTGFTKIALVRYYSMIAPLMLEHLAGRPVSLVRAPEGITGELFFQKHLENARMPGVIQLDPALHPDHPPYLEISTVEGILSAAQMNVIEFTPGTPPRTLLANPTE